MYPTTTLVPLVIADRQAQARTARRAATRPRLWSPALISRRVRTTARLRPHRAQP